MELSHTFTVPAGVDAAWVTFMDLERVGSCFPGAVVTEASHDGFSGTVKVKLGPIALQYAGSGVFLERDDASHRAVIEAKGKDKRGNGTAGATVTVQLTEDGQGTRAEVTTELAITGKPAQFGRGVMQDVSDKLLQQFVTCIESQFVSAATDSADPAPSYASSAPEWGTDGGATTPSAPAVTAPAAATAAPAPANPTGPGGSVSASSGDALDLGATVLPVLAKQYAPYLVSALVGLVLGILISRRRRD